MKIIKMRYQLKPRDRIYAGYGFLSFAKNMGKSLKALRQLVWRLLLRWKNDLDWKKCPISMFSQIFSLYEHVLAALFRKQETNFPCL